MGLFGKSFEKQVQEAIDQVRVKVKGVTGLDARIDGKVVTLVGEAASMDVKAQVMQEFNALVETENTLNTVRVAKVAAPAPAPAAAASAVTSAVTAPMAAPSSVERVHEVATGDTLSALAKKYYGNGSLYMKIFEANKDQLKNPDIIKPGQKLRIPPEPPKAVS